MNTQGLTAAENGKARWENMAGLLFRKKKRTELGLDRVERGPTEQPTEA